jgi:hypothetical protein
MTSRYHGDDMGRQSKEFQKFDQAVKTLLTVPKEEFQRRHAEHKARSAQNPRKRGPKPKVKPPSASDRAGDTETS